MEWECARKEEGRERGMGGLYAGEVSHTVVLK